MPENGDAKTVHATPSKAFFIDMLTQDIGLVECIHDLVDNAVHNLVVEADVDIMENLLKGKTISKLTNARIDISASADSFTITDTAGGISIADARDRVFLFGNPTRDKKHMGLGVYGIGMKRAFFKLGRQITIKSHTMDEEWQIDIDVDEWQDDPKNWDFEFTYERPKKHPSGGTTIKITDLLPVPKSQFGLVTFVNHLRESISLAYGLFLKAGLEVTVNSKPADSDVPEIGESKSIKAIRKFFKDDGVDVLIMAGITPREDREPRGWYVFCNGRMVLKANRSRETGWGVNNFPIWHSKFNHFIGYLYFRSKDVRKLPWTTTKDGVNLESPVYQRALAEMRVQIRPILDVLNSVYEDVREAGEEQRRILDEIKPVDPQKVAARPNSVFTYRPPTLTEADEVNILYKRKKKLVDKIRTFLKKPRMAARSIGEYTFDDFIKRNCS